MNTIVPVKFILSKRTFFISISFTTASFLLQVWDGKTLWEGEGNESVLPNLVPEGMSTQEYFEILKEAFKVQDKENSRFNYGIARHPIHKTDALLKWIIKTKVSPEEEENDEPIIPIDLCGELHLKVVAEDQAKKQVQQMMSSLLSTHSQLDAENKTLSKLNEILKSQRMDAVKLLERLQSEKRKAEFEMYSKFALILNEKKSKIRELRAQLKQSNSQQNTLQKSQSPTLSKMDHRQSQKSQNSQNLDVDLLDAMFESNEIYSLSTAQQTMFPKKTPPKHSSVQTKIPAEISPTGHEPKNLFPSQSVNSSMNIQPRTSSRQHFNDDCFDISPVRKEKRQNSSLSNNEFMPPAKKQKNL